MTDFFKILTRKGRDSAHTEVAVTIDWTGITEAQLKIMARAHITNCLHARFFKHNGPLPEVEECMATDFVHMEYRSEKRFTIPEMTPDADPAWLRSVRKKRGEDKPKPKTFEDSLRAMSKEEREQLLKLLELDVTN